MMELYGVIGASGVWAQVCPVPSASAITLSAFQLLAFSVCALI